MAKLRFGAWIPTYAWSGGNRDPNNVKRIRASIEKCEEHGIDIWVIDHLLCAPGLYATAWLEPLNALAFAAALTRTVSIATGILVLPVRHPVLLAKEIATLCHLSDNRYMFGVGPGWYAREYEVTGSRISERGRRTDEIIEAVTLLLTTANACYQGRYYQFEPRPPTMPAIWVSGGSRVPDDMGCGSKKLTFGHCNFVHLVDTPSDEKAVAQSRAPFLRVMGTHRSYEHLQECYMIGSIDRINMRIDDLRKAGLEYLVLGPVTDDPEQIDMLAQKVVRQFR